MRGLQGLRRLLRVGAYEVELDGGVERRARLYHDRAQREWEEANREQPLEPLTFEEALSSLIEEGLESDEAKRGLAGTIFGEVMSREQMDEHKRRRKS